jgi:DNA-binding NarL/FixJ family response regulator
LFKNTSISPFAAVRKDCRLMIAVVVIDDQELIRMGIQQMLAPIETIEFRGGYTSVDEFRHDPACRSVDVVLLDDTLPATIVVRAAKQILAVHPQAAIIVLGHDLTPYRIHQLLQSRVLGFICKDETVQDMLVTAIHRVYQDNLFFSPETSVLVRGEQALTLSPRLQQVLRLTARGFHVPDIAQMLGTSTRAIYAARARLREVLEVQNDAQLGSEAVRRGLLDDDDLTDE